MGSTGGGFLMGFGVCILLIIIGFHLAILPEYNRQITAARDAIRNTYEISHSSTYQYASIALSNLSLQLEELKMSLPDLAELLDFIPKADQQMREIMRSGNTAFYDVHFRVRPDIGWYPGVFGLLLVAVGVAETVRMTERPPSDKAGVEEKA